MSEEARRGRPLSERKGDWFFVCTFTFFAWSSFFSDLFAGQSVAGRDSFWARANEWYGAMGDPFFAHDFWWFRVGPGISAFVYGPFYLVLIYALITGRNWIRLPALVYVGMMTHGMIEMLYWEFFNPLGLQPTNMAWFLGWNLPYLIVPLLLAARMWKPAPFGRA